MAFSVNKSVLERHKSEHQTAISFSVTLLVYYLLSGLLQQWPRRCPHHGFHQLPVLQRERNQLQIRMEKQLGTPTRRQRPGRKL